MNKTLKDNFGGSEKVQRGSLREKMKACCKRIKEYW